MAMRALRAAAALSLAVGGATSCGGRRNLLSNLPLDLPLALTARPDLPLDLPLDIPLALTARPDLPLDLPLDIPFGAARTPDRLWARLQPSVLSGATQSSRHVCGRPRVGTLDDRLTAETVDNRSADWDPESRADDLRSVRDVNRSRMAYYQ
jgi:hypothetical protein